MSEHKNYIKWFEGSRECFFDQYILPYKDSIFDLISKKIDKDSKKDILNKKPIIGNLWSNISQISKEIHNILSENNSQLTDKNINYIVEEMINMDYGTVSEVFNIISKKLNDLWYINSGKKSKEMSKLFSMMREKSKEHTKIITKR